MSSGITKIEGAAKRNFPLPPEDLELEEWKVFVKVEEEEDEEEEPWRYSPRLNKQLEIERRVVLLTRDSIDFMVQEKGFQFQQVGGIE